jgi:hypothetical protein
MQFDSVDWLPLLGCSVNEVPLELQPHLQAEQADDAAPFPARSRALRPHSLSPWSRTGQREHQRCRRGRRQRGEEDIRGPRRPVISRPAPCRGWSASGRAGYGLAFGC